MDSCWISTTTPKVFRLAYHIHLVTVVIQASTFIGPDDWQFTVKRPNLSSVTDRILCKFSYSLIFPGTNLPAMTGRFTGAQRTVKCWVIPIISQFIGPHVQPLHTSHRQYCTLSLIVTQIPVGSRSRRIAEHCHYSLIIQKNSMRNIKSL